MLIEVHHGDGCVFLVNGDCRAIHLLDYIRNRCCLSSAIKLDLCLINTGQPLHLSPQDSKFVSLDKQYSSSHAHCVLTTIDEDGTYIPLSNDPTLITNEFLSKLRRATGNVKTPDLTKVVTKFSKYSNPSNNDQQKRRRSLKSVASAATVIHKYQH